MREMREMSDGWYRVVKGCAAIVAGLLAFVIVALILLGLLVAYGVAGS